MLEMKYKPNIALAIERHKQLWTRDMRNGVLAKLEIQFDNYSDFNWNWLHEIPNTERMFAAWEHYFLSCKDVDDDAVSVAKTSHGSDAFGGYLGAKVVFPPEGGPGWSKPLLTNWDKLDGLEFDKDNGFFQTQLEALRYYAENAKNRFGVSTTETVDALTLAALLRGAQRAYLDIYDAPEKLRRLMEFGVDFTIRFIELQREIVGCYDGGVFNLFQSWMPGQTIWLGVDAYGPCSPKVYADMGREYQQQLIGHFGGGWMHLHSGALHLLPEVTKLKRLVGIGIVDDPGQPRGFDQLPKIQEVTKDIPLMIECRKEELLEGIEDRTLPGGVMYWVYGASSVEEANRIMERVRDYRAP